MTWLDDLMGCNIYEGGTFVKLRRDLNFIGVNAIDNTSTEAVDIYVAGARDWKESVRLATAAALPAYTFSGATDTITANANGAMPNVDGVAPAVGDRLLLIGAGTTSDVHNGIWVVTSLGGAAAKWALQRDTLADEDDEITPGMHVYVEEGTAYGTHRFVCTNTGAIVVNTTPITLVTMGSTVALVTATTQGSVNAFTAATYMTLQGDGATAGGTWTASPGFGATPGSAFRLNMTDTEWIGWDGTHGMMIDAGGNMHIGDNTTTVNVTSDATTAIIHEIGGVEVTRTIASATQTTQPIYVNSAAGYLRLGLVAGSGAGSAASVGAVRLQDDGQIVFRNAADGGDVAGISADGADTVYVGGAYPTRPTHIYFDATNTLSYRVGGAAKLALSSTTLFAYISNLSFDDNVAAPVISQSVHSAAGVTGDDFTAAAQDVSDPAGNATSGDFVLRGGQGLVHANNTDGNVALHVAPANWQAMEKGLFVADCVTAPTGNPAAGGFLFSSGGGGWWRGSGGTVTNFGPSAPRCSACGHDFWRQAQCSPRFDAYLLECGWCGKVYKKGPESILADLDTAELDELIYDDAEPDPRPPHKQRKVIESMIGPAFRNKDCGPTLQEYRRRCTAAIDEAEPVKAGKDIDQAATRAAVSAAVDAIRAEWVDPWQSWRDLYALRDDAVTLTAQLEADIAQVDAETDGALAVKEWEASAPAEMGAGS